MSWPLHDLVLTTPDLELRGLTEAHAHELSLVAPDDLEHHPKLAHLGADVLQAYWRNAGLWLPSGWVLDLVVLRDGVPIGLQGVEAKDLRTRRTVDTYSWLVPAARGLGLGKQMRAAVLSLAFGHLGAQWAVTEAWSDNAPSLGVSRSLGYVDNGVTVHPGPRVMQGMVLTAAAWTPPCEVGVAGLAPCLPWFGL